MKNVLIIGASSLIAQHVARKFAAEGSQIYLAGRDVKKLEIIRDDLIARGASKVGVYTIDFKSYDQHQKLFDSAKDYLGEINVAIIAYGTLSKQDACQASVAETIKELELNLISIISLLTIAAECFAQNQSGCIVAISSVAGDRGRQSNYVYGTAKGALSIFLQGLRNRLHKKGVNVLTVKPGFVDTPMTESFKKGILWTKPERIATDIYNAIQTKKDIIYSPWFWRWIMLAIKLIPERIFKRMSL